MSSLGAPWRPSNPVGGEAATTTGVTTHRRRAHAVVQRRTRDDARQPAAVAQLDGPAPELDRARVQWAGPLRQLIRWSPDPAGERSRLAVARLGLRQRQCRDQQSDPHVPAPEIVPTDKIPLRCAGCPPYPAPSLFPL